MNNFDKASKILEFDKILSMLSACALTDGAKKKALTLIPDTDIGRIRKRLLEVDEAKRLAGIKGAPSFWGVTDVGDSLERAEKGAQLTTGELLSVSRLLTCVRTLKAYP